MAEIVGGQACRNSELDGCKFLLICLVVIGHCIEPTRYMTAFSGHLYSCIYLFHMPLFVILSGYFTKDGVTLLKLFKSSIGLLETYFFVTTFIILFVTRDVSNMLSPVLSTWYLLSLIFWRYLVFFMGGVKGLHKNLLAISIILSALTFVSPFDYGKDILALNRTLQFFPFFCLGYYLRTIDFVCLKRSHIRHTLLLLSISLIAILGLLDSRLIHLLCFRRSSIFVVSRETNIGYTQLLLVKLYVDVSAVVISLCVLSFSEFLKKFALWGRYTMTIFVVQALLVHSITYKLPVNVILELALSIVVIIAGIWISNKGYGKFLRNPVTSLIKSCVNVV